MQKGQSCNLGNCKVFFIENSHEYSRLGLIVGKKVGNAPMRNAWKRRLRESFRLEREHFHSHLDVVVLVKGKGEIQSMGELRTMFQSIGDVRKK